MPCFRTCEARLGPPHHCAPVGVAAGAQNGCESRAACLATRKARTAGLSPAACCGGREAAASPEILGDPKPHHLILAALALVCAMISIPTAKSSNA
eukprot:CAMPEP_0174751076 /NCGR_PEP_ID=MMETSP1094-20130205/99094_1 /TAXON_ID=156173 /ORGANISM="Chrysochromulina brevifilum, Strain UTEX LB 985" /LENGTH=95 /DNA_ID=CAMNT_0015956515 /DNA_START=226 /DNA_END=513 /DNA_ORIENTATION=+